jgi:hypothetical protein
MANIIVGDIDGCVLDNEHRIAHYISGDIARYHELHLHDKPMPACIAIYQKFIYDFNYRLLFITARDEVARTYTLNQLRHHVSPRIDNSQLLMRDHNKHLGMHDTELKPLLLRAAGFELSDVLFAVDDRDSVVAAWRALGVTCLQPQPGPF